MVVLVTEIAKYIFVLLMMIYTVSSYVYMISDDRQRGGIHGRQIAYVILFDVIAFAVLYLHTENMKVLMLGSLFLTVLLIALILYSVLYPLASFIVLCNMAMFLSVGFVMIMRLSYDNEQPLNTAVRQLIFMGIGLLASLFVPVIIRRFRYASRATVIYGVSGFVLLLFVAMFAVTTHGAKLGFTVFGFGIQPSEFVKILFVFYVAGALSSAACFRDLCVTTAVAAAHVLILVLSTDLGAALIFFVVYIVMLYVATGKLRYAGAGLVGGAAASVIGYHLFSHIRVRVSVWRDPFASYSTGGYQVAQSLFAIGTGSWFGMGLFCGLPDSIPVAETDFIFSAIVEEFGLIFALGLVLICVCCYLTILTISTELKNHFYKLVALGLGTCYMSQVFLTIGGVTKFIPSTGVTLPLVSYGGSSVLSTLIMFGIIQGLYIVRNDESEIEFEEPSEDKEDSVGTESRLQYEEEIYGSTNKERRRKVGGVRSAKRRTPKSEVRQSSDKQRRRRRIEKDEDRFEEVR